MSITFACDCGKRYTVANELAGRQATCKVCGKVITVPRSAQKTPAARPAAATGDAGDKEGRVPPLPTSTPSPVANQVDGEPTTASAGQWKQSQGEIDFQTKVLLGIGVACLLLLAMSTLMPWVYMPFSWGAARFSMRWRFGHLVNDSSAWRCSRGHICIQTVVGVRCPCGSAWGTMVAIWLIAFAIRISVSIASAGDKNVFAEALALTSGPGVGLFLRAISAIGVTACLAYLVFRSAVGSGPSLTRFIPLAASQGGAVFVGLLIAIVPIGIGSTGSISGGNLASEDISGGNLASEDISGGNLASEDNGEAAKERATRTVTLGETLKIGALEDLSANSGVSQSACEVLFLSRRNFRKRPIPGLDVSGEERF